MKPVAVADPPAPIRWSPLAFPFGTEEPPAHVELAPAIEPGHAARMLGNLDGKRVLELGCGTGHNAVAMAAAGARVICIDPSIDRLADARAITDAADVRVEYHHGDLAELAFLRADYVDVAVAAYSLAEVADLGRVFRQVSRVLTNEAPFLVSLPHPLFLATSLDTTPAPQMTRPYFDGSPLAWSTDAQSGTAVPHLIGDLLSELRAAGFRSDAVWEPASDEAWATAHWSPAGEWLPFSVIVRAVVSR
jgi:SAM-dependent methyltransferase